MKNRVIAVCDSDISFSKSFAEYVNKKSKGYFFAEVFTEIDLLIDTIYAEKKDILLVSEDADIRRLEKKFGVENIIVLAKNSEIQKDIGLNVIYKYQSAESILKEIMNLYGNISNSDMKIVGKKCQIIGVYSPVGRIMKTSFALTLGQVFAQEKHCLYINMDSYSGFSNFLNKEYMNDLSDVMYYLRQKNINFVAKLEGITDTINGLEYIPPVESMLSLKEVTGKEWCHLISELKNSSTYERVVIDFNNNVDELISVLDECDKIYFPVKSDFISLAKIEQFEKNVKASGNISVLDLIEKIEIPMVNFGTKESYMHELMWGELGDFVRELINEK